MPTLTATSVKIPNPRETLQYMLLEACQALTWQRVVPKSAFTEESKVPKKLPNAWTNTEDELGELAGLVLIKIGIL